MATISSDELDYRRLGRVIVQLRQESGMSQATLAEAVERSEAAVSRWETGKATPTAFDLRRISSVFLLPPAAADVLIHPPAIYSPEMERVFGAIADQLGEAAASGVAEGVRRGIRPDVLIPGSYQRSTQVPDKPAPSPERPPRGAGAKPG